MEQELLDLVARIGSDDNPPTDKDLTDAELALAEAATAVLEGDDPDDEAGAAIVEALEQVRSEITSRVEAAEAKRSRAAELLARVTPAEEAADTTDEATEETVEEPAAVAAANTDRRRLASAVQAARSRIEDDATPPASHGSIRAVGAAQGEKLTPQATFDDLGAVFFRNARTIKSPGARQALVTIESAFPEGRMLDHPTTDKNTRLLDTVMGVEAITAAGGICDPLPADFSRPFFGDRGRPIRDALPRFGAPRGGVRFSPAFSAFDLNDAITLWDYETDESPGESVKACPRIDCEEEHTAHVDAIVRCLTIGNFQARFNPELWAASLRALIPAYDRVAEQALWADMVAEATLATFTSANGSSTIANILQSVSKAAAGIRSRERILNDRYLRAIFPSWVRDALKADTTGQTFGAAPGAALGVTDAEVNRWFLDRGVQPVWSPDLQVFAAQTPTAALAGWPNHGGASTGVDYLIYPEGAYFHLDGGTLDLGTEITDSVLNQTNDRQAFAEGFEKAVYRGGVDPLLVRVPVVESCLCAGGEG